MSLISGHSQTPMEYEPTLWAKVFHSIPHVNITFHDVDPKFNPENDLYLESLGILASVPAGKMKLLFDGYVFNTRIYIGILLGFYLVAHRNFNLYTMMGIKNR